jgi:hypothetical protein
MGKGEINMKKYKVTHIVLCEVATYRVIEAENEQDLLDKISKIETYTCSDDNYACDTEICADREVIQTHIMEIVK